MDNETNEPDMTLEEVCAAARAMFLESIRTLQGSLKAFEASPTPMPSDVQKAAKAVNDALQTVFKERERLEKFTEGASGLFVGAPIDFDQARQEVERRMDRLRATRGEEKVP